MHGRIGNTLKDFLVEPTNDKAKYIRERNSPFTKTQIYYSQRRDSNDEEFLEQNLQLYDYLKDSYQICVLPD